MYFKGYKKLAEEKAKPSYFILVVFALMIVGALLTNS